MKLLLTALLSVSFPIHVAAAQGSEPVTQAVYKCARADATYWVPNPIEDATCNSLGEWPVHLPGGWILHQELPIGKIYYKPNGMVKKGDTITIWTLQVFNSKQRLSSFKKYRSVMDKLSINCIERRYRILEEYMYADMSAGSSPMSTANDAEIIPLIPGSVFDKLADMTCTATSTVKKVP